jgi:hypothetical protein
MTKRDREQSLAAVAEMERVMADVIAGKSVMCKVCSSPLTYYAPGSGRHPGVYCANGCTEMLMNFARKK